MISDHVQDPAEDQVIGYLGDFSQIIWGQVGGLSWDVTDQATLNIDGGGRVYIARKEDPNAYHEHKVADDTLAALQAQADKAGQLIPGGASHE